MELRVYLAVLCTGAFLFCSVSAAGISLKEAISGGTQDSGISIPALPPPEGGSVLQEKYWIPSLIFSKLLIAFSLKLREAEI